MGDSERFSNLHKVTQLGSGKASNSGRLTPESTFLVSGLWMCEFVGIHLDARLIPILSMLFVCQGILGRILLEFTVSSSQSRVSCLGRSNATESSATISVRRGAGERKGHRTDGRGVLVTKVKQLPRQNRSTHRKFLV